MISRLWMNLGAIVDHLCSLDLPFLVTDVSAASMQVLHSRHGEPPLGIHSHAACLCLIMEVPTIINVFFFGMINHFQIIISTRRKAILGQSTPYVCCSRVAVSWSHRCAATPGPQLARHDRAVHVTHRATTDPPRRSGVGLSSEGDEKAQTTESSG